jgi:hypothetical protein
MKLPRLRRRPDPEPGAETAEPASASVAVPVLQVLIYSNTSLPEQEFSAQTDKLRRIASYDGDTRSWYTSLPLDHPERAAEVLTVLYEAARLHGTTIQVRARPAGEGSPSGQAAGAS